MRFILVLALLAATSGFGGELKGTRGSACEKDEAIARAKIWEQLSQKHDCRSGLPRQEGGWTCKKSKGASCQTVIWNCITQYSCESVTIPPAAPPAKKVSPTRAASEGDPKLAELAGLRGPEKAPEPVTTEGGMPMTFPEMKEPAKSQCNKLLSGADECTPAKCESIDDEGVATGYELKRGKGDTCEFLHTVRQGKQKDTITCSLTPEHAAYAGDFKLYLAAHIEGGPVTQTPCATPEPGAKVAGDVGCRITRNGRTFVDFVQFGKAKGFCKGP